VQAGKAIDPTIASSAASVPRFHLGRWVMAAAILALAVIWRLIGIQTTEAWRDEAVTLIHLQSTWHDLVTRLPLVEDSPPMFFLLLKAWSLLFTSEWTQRLLAVVFGAATVAMLMALAERIRPGSWWIAGLLVAFSPVPVHYSQELRVYSLLMLLVVLSLWATEMIARDPKSRGGHFLWGLFAALAAHCHAIGVFIYPMTAAYLLVRLGWSRKWAILSPWSTVTWLVGCSPMFWFNIHWALRHKTTGWWIDPVCTTTTLDLIHSFTGVLVVTQWIQEALKSGWIGPLTKAAIVFIFGTCGLLIGAGLWNARTRRAAAGLLLAFAVFTGLMVATSLTGVPNMIDRTLLPAWVPILALFGIAAAPTRGRPMGNILLTGSALLMAGLWAAGWGWLARYSENERRYSQSDCFRWVRADLGPDDMIVITPSWLEDSAAWYLREVICGEQLFTIDAQAYSGRPPHHTLMHPRITVTDEEIKEGPWSQRIRAAIRERQGRQYSVWLISGYWQELLGNDPVVEQLESFFKTGFRRVDKYTPPHLTGIVARRYVPVTATITPAQPASQTGASPSGVPAGSGPSVQ
jgi:hypothetical protein